jgi:nitrogenase molybdenum-iron protein alpha/beta subunit
MNTLPGPPEGDAFTGAILAVEGIRDAAVLLNGPTGCKFYHAAVSDAQLPRVTSLDPLTYQEEFYFGQPRVPATYLDRDDFIFGASDKLERILPRVADKGHGLIAVVNSPGAALIGDDLDRFIRASSLSVPCVALESTGFSGRITEGYQQAVRAVLERLGPAPAEPAPKSVNLIGLSILHKHWEGSLAELRTLFGRCGIEVACTVCAGTTVSELRSLRRAQCNVVLHEEYAEEVVPWLEQAWGIPSLLLEQGAPVGFDATEGMLRQVGDFLGVDPGPGLRAVEEARGRSFSALARFHSLTGLPKGATFALQADPSVALPLTRWLYGYLGMIPVSAITTPVGAEGLAGKLEAFLQDIGQGDAWQAPILPQNPDIILADGNTLAWLRTQGLQGAWVDISLPGVGTIDVDPKAMLGPRGGLHLLERILNGLNELD